MADNDSAQEKTEEATPKRREDAKKKGQVARSRDLTTMIMLLGAGLTLVATANYTGGALLEIMQDVFTQPRDQLFEDRHLVNQLRVAIIDGLVAIAPFLGAMFVVALAAPAALGGWVMSGEAVKFDAKKLDPIKGMGRVFGTRGLTEMLKALAKFVLIGLIGYLMLQAQLDAIGGLALTDVDPAILNVFGIISATFFVTAGATAIIALIDVPLQLWQHGKQLKMTRQEIKEEFKDTDGRPEIKGKLRQMQQEVASRRMMQEVPTADVVITNPTHFSVALRYDQGKMSAPRVIALGGDHMAFAIRTVAKDNGVPLVEAPPLARALFHTTEVGQDVPADLYLAVAQVLAWVYQLKAGAAVGSAPNPEVPEDFIF